MRYFIIFIMMFLAACSGKTSPSEPVWSIVQQSSEVSFWTIKNGSISEQHKFLKFEGIAGNGKAVVRVDLASVETNIDIRNERMLAYLFEVDTHPEMVISAKIDMADYQDLKPGDLMEDSLDVTVSMHGTKKTYNIQVNIERNPGEFDWVAVRSAEPIIVEAKDFGMIAGVEKLRELAGLDSISTQVPVKFALVFSR